MVKSVNPQFKSESDTETVGLKDKHDKVIETESTHEFPFDVTSREYVELVVGFTKSDVVAVSYTHLRAHETR
mgnify:CR=1 FL=1